MHDANFHADVNKSLQVSLVHVSIMTTLDLDTHTAKYYCRFTFLEFGTEIFFFYYIQWDQRILVSAENVSKFGTQPFRL